MDADIRHNPQSSPQHMPYAVDIALKTVKINY